MAEDKTKDVVKREIEKINKYAEINEAYFIGLLWSDPFVNYSEYRDTISQDEFIHSVWGFYYELGRRMYEDGIQKFDDITVHTKAKEYNIEDEFREFGKTDTVNDAIDIVGEHVENIEYYYETIKKNYVIRQLFTLFGDKVLLPKGKYDWNKMNREQLTKFWGDKLNKISLENVNKYEAENLYIDADDFIRKLEEESADMLPLYKSYSMNSITQGIPRGAVTMIGGFGGTGKTSIISEKFIMSCVVNKEKTIVVLNEEDAQSFRQKIVLSILYHEFHTGIDRKRFVNGKLQEEDKVKIRSAFDKMRELIDSNESQIKVIFMEKYVMSDLEKIVKFWANRGYTNLLIDTHKISDESRYDQRWHTFVEDMKTIYRWTRKEAGGMNLRTVVSFQLADSAIRSRYLTFDAIGEGKASKNEASIVNMFRVVWDDEYEGGDKELKCYKLKKNNKTGKYDKEFFTLEKGKTYYLWFTPKNRYGSDNDNGQPILVIEPNFNFNNFKEIGWTFVAKDYN